MKLAFHIQKVAANLVEEEEEPNLSDVTDRNYGKQLPIQSSQSNIGSSGEVPSASIFALCCALLLAAIT